MKLRKPSKLSKGRTQEVNGLVSVQLFDETVQFQMDTGVQVNVLPKRIFDRFKPRPNLMKTLAVLMSFACREQIQASRELFCHLLMY